MVVKNTCIGHVDDNDHLSCIIPEREATFYIAPQKFSQRSSGSPNLSTYFAAVTNHKCSSAFRPSNLESLLNHPTPNDNMWKDSCEEGLVESKKYDPEVDSNILDLDMYRKLEEKTQKIKGKLRGPEFQDGESFYQKLDDQICVNFGELLSLTDRYASRGCFVVSSDTQADAVGMCGTNSHWPPSWRAENIQDVRNHLDLSAAALRTCLSCSLTSFHFLMAYSSFTCPDAKKWPSFPLPLLVHSPTLHFSSFVIKIGCALPTTYLHRRAWPKYYGQTSKGGDVNVSEVNIALSDCSPDNSDVSRELTSSFPAARTMCPFSRGHFETGTIDHEPWACGDECEEYYSTKGSDLKETVLPKAIWRCFDFDAIHLDLPLFYLLGGYIILVGPCIQHMGKVNPIDTLILLVALDGQGKAKGTLLEDYGDGYECRQGQFLLTYYEVELSSAMVFVKVVGTEGLWKRPKRKLNVQLLLGESVRLEAWGMDQEEVRIEIPLAAEATKLVEESHKQRIINSPCEVHSRGARASCSERSRVKIPIFSLIRTEVKSGTRLGHDDQNTEGEFELQLLVANEAQLVILHCWPVLELIGCLHTYWEPVKGYVSIHASCFNQWMRDISKGSLVERYILSDVLLEGLLRTYMLNCCGCTSSAP
eukprot:Gb_20133 [translate_table: standard]